MTEQHHALLILQEMKSDWYKPPESYNMRKEQFQLLSYQNWAMDELILQIQQNIMCHPYDVVEEFHYNMVSHSVETDSPTVSYMFSIAADVALDVLDVFHASF